MKDLVGTARTDGTGASSKKAQKFRLRSASLTMSTPLPEAHYGKKWLLVSKPKPKKNKQKKKKQQRQKGASTKAGSSSSTKKKRGRASKPAAGGPSDPNPQATKKPKLTYGIFNISIVFDILCQLNVIYVNYN